MLIDLHRCLTRALPLAGSRRLADGPTTAELQHEANFAESLRSPLEGLYRWPLRNGLAAVPDGSAAQIRRWLLGQYADEESTAVLRFVLFQNLRAGVNVGGQLALDELGLASAGSATFNLTNSAVVAQVDRFALRLVSLSGSLSVVYTTAAELARQITVLRDAQESAEAQAQAVEVDLPDRWLVFDGRVTDGEVAAHLSSWINGRAAVRSAAIGQNESVRSTRAGLSMTYGRNGVSFQILRNSAGACPQCIALNGERYPVTVGFVVGVAPVHPGCNCYYVPDTADWSAPEEVWTGG